MKCRLPWDVPAQSSARCILSLKTWPSNAAALSQSPLQFIQYFPHLFCAFMDTLVRTQYIYLYCLGHLVRHQLHGMLEFVRGRPEHFDHHEEFELLLLKLIFSFAPVTRLVYYMVCQSGKMQLFFFCHWQAKLGRRLDNKCCPAALSLEISSAQVIV